MKALYVVLLMAGLVFGRCFAASECGNASWGYSQNGNKIKLSVPELKKTSKIMFIADAHFSSDDGLEGEYKDFASRMNKYGERDFGKLKKTLALAEKQNYDAVVLCGDMINFPSKHNADSLLECIKGAKIPVYYTSGNHDWHFEGDSGSDLEQRARWVEKVLLSLYQDANWKLYSRNIGGVKFIILDNSTYEILPEQLKALRKELSENLPTIICAHIPFYVPDSPVGFGCGHPKWCAETDPYPDIERRLRWPAAGHSQTTFDFWREIFSSPNVLGIFAGHTHKLSTHFHLGKFQTVAPSYNRKGEFLEITLSPAK